MIFEWPLWQIALLVMAGLGLDALLGEPRRWHPLVGFGRVAQAVETRLNRGRIRTVRGIVAWCVVVLPWVVGAAYGLDWLAQHAPAVAWLGHALLLYWAIGLRSLREHTAAIATALAAGDLAMARQWTRYIVSRDTEQATPSDLAKAGIESLLENGNDAAFAALFCFVIGGGPAVVLFRLANTLDAMWGYRNARFSAFGMWAARVDDVLNYIPARLTALSYALLGQTRLALHCWRTQAPAWPSPNAGPVMSAGAGALGLALGGRACYDGIWEQRPPLGLGCEAQGEDIDRAWRLVRSTALAWCVLLGSAGAFMAWNGSRL